MASYMKLPHTNVETAEERLEELIKYNKIPQKVFIHKSHVYGIFGIKDLRIFPDGIECIHEKIGERLWTLYCEKRNTAFVYDLEEK